jgi:hypothetical protein
MDQREASDGWRLHIGKLSHAAIHGEHLNMQHSETRQLRKHYAANRKRNRERAAKKFAKMRAAKERLRIERANAEPQMPDTSHCEPAPKLKPRGF